jgi:hypothetical protein
MQQVPTQRTVAQFIVVVQLYLGSNMTLPLKRCNSPVCERVETTLPAAAKPCVPLKREEARYEDGN